MRKTAIVIARMDAYEIEEEELLRLQARMENGAVVPAAKVERVGSASNKGVQQAGNLREGQSDKLDGMRKMNEFGLLPILGDVIERDVMRESGGEKGLHSSIGSINNDDDKMNSEDGIMKKMRYFPVAEHRKKSRFTLGKCRESNLADMGLQPEIPVGDADSIISGMTPDEVTEARDEILARFKGSTIEFLRNRGAKKKNVEIDSQTQSNRTDIVKGKIPGEELNSSLREPLLNSMLFSDSLLSRFRFSRDGSLDSSLAPKKQTWESVIKRDPIRHEVQSVGMGGQYYHSFDELYVLCRSTEFRQRGMGMSFLGDLLSACRKHLVRNDVLDVSPELADVIQREGLGKLLPLQWIDIWHHVTYSLQIAKLIRFSMDDSNSVVVVESLKSLTQYIGASPDEIKMMEACDAYPAIGLPRFAFSHIQRQGYGTEWLSAPLDLQSTVKTMVAGQHNAPLAEEELDEQDLARVDPLSGLLNMNLIDRIIHLMQRKDFQSDTSRMLALQCLHALAQSGMRACEKMASESLALATLSKSLTVIKNGNQLDIVILNILKLLFQSSKSLCVSSASQPIRGKIKAIILSNALDSPQNGTGLDCFKICLQIWRAWLINDASILYFDDAFSSLCSVMFPSWDRDTDWKRAWPCAREGLLLAAVSCTKKNISEECCQALMKQVLDWLREIPYPLSFVLDENANSEEEILKYELNAVLSAAFFFFSCSWKLAKSWEASHRLHLKGLFSEFSFFSESSVTQFWQHLCRNFGSQDQYLPNQEIQILSCGSLAYCMTEFQLIWGEKNPNDMACTFDEVIAMLGHFISDSAARGVQIEQIMQPWQIYSLQNILNLGRIFTSITSFALDHKMLSNMTAVADTSMRLLVTLPPGADDVALRLLSLLFSRENCHGPLNDALEIVKDYLKRFDILSGVESLPETLQAESLRRDALSGISKNILGYNLESYTSEKILSIMQYDSMFSVILQPEESRLPLEDTWMFSKFDVPRQKQTSSITFKRSILFWIIGNELQNRLSSISSHKKLFSLIDFVFHEVASDDQHNVKAWMDESIQAGTAFLVDRYLPGVVFDSSDSSTSMGSSISKYVTESFASESFGNPFFGAIIACLLCENVSKAQLREEILSILKDEHAMHHMPRLQYLLGPLENYFPSTVDGILDWKLLADILGSAEFGKCLESESSLVDICLHNVVFILDTKGKTHGPTLLHRLSRWKGTDGYQHILKYLLHWSPLSKNFDTGLQADRLHLLQAAAAELLE